MRDVLSVCLNLTPDDGRFGSVPDQGFFGCTPEGAKGGQVRCPFQEVCLTCSISSNEDIDSRIGFETEFPV